MCYKQLVRDSSEKIDEDEKEISIERKKKASSDGVFELVTMSTEEAASGLQPWLWEVTRKSLFNATKGKGVSEVSDFRNVTNN